MSHTILVIDDEQSVRKLIAEILAFAGFEVLEASGGTSGAQLAKETLPDLILCDVSMPDQDGFQTLRQVRQDANLAATPFVFLTGKTDHEDMRQGMVSGADDYLTKPFSANELIESVQARLDRRSQVSEASEKKLDDLRGNIVHMLPHELRTPLQGIIGFADILQDEYQDMEREQVGEMATHIMKSAQRLHRVVENFLVYAQIQVYRKDQQKLKSLQAETTPVSQEIIQSLIEQCPAAQSRIDDLSLWVAEETVSMSVGDLTKVVLELVDNAIKFSESGTPIEITGLADENNYRLSIQDYGRGMTSEQVQHIGAYTQFDRRFYEQQGTGLGLTIAKELVELHKGSLSVDSDAETFTKVELSFQIA